MERQPVTVDRISWRDICPPLTILRALPSALSLTALVLAMLGAVLCPVGWIVMERICLSEQALNESPELASIAETNRSTYRAVFPEAAEAGSAGSTVFTPLQGIGLVFSSIGNPVGQLFSLESGIWRFMYFLGGSLWTILVWSFVGCAISRVALMRLTREESIGLGGAISFASNKFLSCFAGVLIPLLAVFGLAIPLAIVGLVMTLDIGATIAGFLWLIVLTLSFLIAIILLGLMFAWPLVVSAVTCEGQDSFDGMSRAFAYVFQRPVHYFVYGLIALLFSGVCWVVVSNVVEGSIKSAWWATSWGSNIAHDRTSELRPEQPVIPFGARRGFEDFAPNTGAVLTNSNGAGNSTDTEKTESASLKLGRTMIRFWEGVAKTLGAAFLYGLFWSLAAAIYLLLRKDLDNTEMDEIYLVEQRRTYELPPLKATSSGVPAVDDDQVLPAEVDSASPTDEN